MSNTESPRMKPLYAVIARLAQSRLNCIDSANVAWKHKHMDTAEALVKQHMPSGSGIDSGTQLDWSKSTGNRLTFTLGFHHMHEHGFYDGWTYHNCIVTPSLADAFTLRITGRDRNQVKDYLYDVYDQALRALVPA